MTRHAPTPQPQTKPQPQAQAQAEAEAEAELQPQLQAEPGRRALLSLSLGLGLGLTVATATAAPPSRAHAAPNPDRKPPALAAAGRELLTGELRHTTVIQSFAFDEQWGHIYALQVVSSGVQLPGEDAPRTHAERSLSGDLCLNRLNMDGSPAGHMYLKGFGHGGSIGLQPSTVGPTLWTEWDANPRSGYGRGVCRFRFADGQVLYRDSDGLLTYHPVPGSTSNYPALDLLHQQLLLRYKTKGVARFALYDLNRFRARSFRPLADFPQPGADLDLPFQGMTLYGDHAYQLLGRAYGPDNPPSSGGDARLYRIDLRTGQVDWEQLEQTAPDLNPREPEGLAILYGRRFDPRLCLGFTEGPPGARRYRLYYKALR
ncbi:phage baseplate protein [Streptomyces apocyni]|uniref:phage baseplate protein n=1 Tax=Streptomyces apocyni TaxID=2654677 RepID=UPI0012EAAFC8|nr:teichoic acid biosynthesis protein C [Streptomyces apocyni]